MRPSKSEGEPSELPKDSKSVIIEAGDPDSVFHLV